MAEIIPCPQCRRKLQLSEAYYGQLVQCPECGHTFTAAPVAANAPPLARPAPPKPREVSERDLRLDHGPLIVDRRTHEPHRGGFIKTIGLLGLVGGFIAIVPVVLGPLAWYWGRQDLIAMEDGHMDPRGKSDTRTGKNCGIAATMLLLLYGAVCCCVIGNR